MYKIFKYSDEDQIIVEITQENWHGGDSYSYAYRAKVVKIFSNSCVYKLGEECGPLKEYCHNIEDPNTLLKRLL